MSDHSVKRVIIVGAVEFQQALLHTLIASWAASERLELLSLPANEVYGLAASDSGIVLLIYDAASSHVAPQRRLVEVQVLKILRPDVPIVVFSDSADPEEFAAMLDIAVQAYLHNAAPHDIAVRALSFVVHGGTYFSPNMMIAAHHRLHRGARSLPRAPPSASHSLLDSKSHNDKLGQPLERSEPTDEPAVHGLAAKAQQTSPASGNVTGLSDRLQNEKKLSTSLALLGERQRAVLQHLCAGDSNKTIAKKLNLTETTVKFHVREIMRKLGVSNRTQVAAAAAGRMKS